MSNVIRFSNAEMLLPGGMVQRGSFTVSEGRFVEINSQNIQAIKTIDLKGKIVLPGFFDVQVNGGGGVLFNDNPSIDTIERISKVHLALGTTSFLPTLISDDLNKVEIAINAVESAIEEGVPGVKGIHLEGPFLNSQKKGVHDADKFRSIDDEAIELISRLSNGRTLITLAPELTTLDSISKLVSRGVIVAAGHTMASYDQTLSAIEAGLTGFTHLFNAMPQIQSRDPGCITAALEYNDTYCGMIVDGYHVDPAVLRLALRAKHGKKGMFLVSDAMRSVGTDLKEFSLFGEPILVDGGKCLTEDGTLAGAHLSMFEAVQNSVLMLQVDLATAARMASETPADFINLGDVTGRLQSGLDADFLVIDSHSKLQQVWARGDCMLGDHQS